MFNLQAKSKESKIAENIMYGTIREWEGIKSSDFAVMVARAKKSGIKQINHRIHSPGGVMLDGLAIIATIQAGSIDHYAYVDGLAASMMANFVVACKKAYMAKSARIMIHQGSGGVAGSAAQIQNYGKLLESLNNDQAEILAKKTGKEKQWILDNWLAEGQDKWFTAKEALDAGLIDGIVDDKVAIKSEAEAKSMDMVACYDQAFESITNNEFMKKEQLIQALKLKADASDDDIMAAIDSLDAKEPDKSTSDNQNEKGVEAFLKMAEMSGFLTEENKSSLTKIAQSDLSAALDLLPKKPAKPGPKDDGARLSSIIKALNKPDDNEKKVWADYTEKELAKMQDSDPNKFEALYNAEFQS